MTQLPTEIERKLIERCLDDDRMAQRELFLKYKDAMYTILCRMLNDEEEAADALQETFVSVFKALNSYKHQSTLGAWIKSIVVRTGIAFLRRKSRLEVIPVDQVNSEPIIWPESLNGEILEKAIAQLSDGYRSVFLLIEVEGYSHQEVGKMLGISDGTSKSQLYHAKKRLQQMLKEN
ncbi:RNA polymerase sigma factor [Ekhidna sp.]